MPEAEKDLTKTEKPSAESRKSSNKLYSILREGSEDILKLDYEAIPFSPSIEDNSACMSDVIEKLSENPSVSRVIFSQRRNYNYDMDQVQMLVEIALIYSQLVKRKSAFGMGAIGTGEESEELLAYRYSVIQSIVFDLLKSDPLGAYVDLKRKIRTERALQKQASDSGMIESIRVYLSVLEEIYGLLDKTKLVIFAKPYLAGYQVGDRSVYRSLFRPSISPDFMFTKLVINPPEGGRQLSSYKVGDTDVAIYSVPNDVKYLYHITPPEFKLTEDKYALINLAKSVLSEHQPKEEEFLNPEKLRTTFSNIGGDLLRELAEHRGIDLSNDEVKELTEVLIRNTIGFGMIEVLLRDENIQDITINSPMGQTPIFVLHSEFNECYTNITPASSDFESWGSKFRLLSGRPLDEANPILDTELTIPGARSRVSIINKPLNPYGLAFAFRRHRDKPWTLPLLIKYKMLNPLAAGLLSFLIQGSRTMLVAGTRSSGKTSLLGACLLEIMRKYRILTIEDTLELQTEAMRELGYNIQPMKVRSALTKGGTELEATEGIRTSLRLGDSALIVGEVRSEEAKALYEAMRVGALANVVAGTIHGDSPYGVFDRVVNDIGVPRTSFKATDIIVVANPLKSPDGMHKWRRVTQITEVRKTWEDDPLTERGFVDLMKYNANTDQLEPTGDLINGESEILKSIGANVKEWTGNWDAIWDNIILRANIKEALVKYAEQVGDDTILEAEFVLNSSDQMQRISEQVREKFGELDSKKIFEQWEEWLKKVIRDKNY
ncbi:MAG: type II/IV secretion system ATPase subunit [archaeon]